MNVDFIEIGTSDFNTLIEKADDNSVLQDFADIYNTTGQLSWELTPARIRQKLGSRGTAYVLYDDGVVVGTAGVKTIQEYGYTIGEIGYLYLDDDHKNIRNLFMLYNAAMRGATKFDVVITTTNVNNKTINTLLNKSSNFEKIFLNQSQYSSNKLFVWLGNANSGNASYEEQVEAAREYYEGNIIQDFSEV